MKAENIEEFLGTLQQSTVEAWKKHLKTDKYSAHIALNEFYEDIVDLVDALIEEYQGINGKVEHLKNIMPSDELNAVEYLESLRELTKEGRKEFFEDQPELQSDTDAILSLIDSTLYKLKELKENAKGSKLGSFIAESLCISESADDLIYYIDAEGLDDDDEVLPITMEVHIKKKYKKRFEHFIDAQDGSFQIMRASSDKGDYTFEN